MSARDWKELRERRTSLLKLWSAARLGKTAAIDELYAIAKDTLPKQSADNRDEIIADAMLQVLVNATEPYERGSPRYIDQQGNVTLRGFRGKVIHAVKRKASDSTIDKFRNNSTKMFLVVARYHDRFGLAPVKRKKS